MPLREIAASAAATWASTRAANSGCAFRDFRVGQAILGDQHGGFDPHGRPAEFGEVRCSHGRRALGLFIPSPS
jgi:hypothetical protein